MAEWTDSERLAILRHAIDSVKQYAIDQQKECRQQANELGSELHHGKANTWQEVADLLEGFDA